MKRRGCAVLTALLRIGHQRLDLGFLQLVNNEQRCERLGFYFLIYFLTRFRRRFWQRIFGIVIIRPQQKGAPIAPNGYLGKH